MIEFSKKNNIITADNVSEIDRLKSYHKKHYGYEYSERFYKYNGILKKSKKVTYIVDKRFSNIMEYLVRDTNCEIKLDSPRQKALVKAYWSF